MNLCTLTLPVTLAPEGILAIDALPDAASEVDIKIRLPLDWTVVADKILSMPVKLTVGNNETFPPPLFTVRFVNVRPAPVMV